jgi:hypothetical protein
MDNFDLRKYLAEGRLEKEMGVDFNSFDQGSYQEEEVSAEEAMKIYNKIK